MMQNKIIIALTGGSGCGKSVVAKAASDLGFKHIDADLIGHDIILKPQKAYYEIVKMGRCYCDLTIYKKNASLKV